MKTDRELLNLALKLVAKYHARETVLVDWEKSVIEAINARLAEDDDEPVAWYDKHGMITHDPFEGVTPLYTRPTTARKPLSDEEIMEIKEEIE